MEAWSRDKLGKVGGGLSGIRNLLFEVFGRPVKESGRAESIGAEGAGRELQNP